MAVYKNMGCGLILWGLLAAPAVAQDVDAGATNIPVIAASFSKQQISRQIIDLAYPVENRSNFIATTMAAIANQIRDATLSADDKINNPQLIAILDRHLDKMLGKILDDFNDNSDGLFDAMVAAYAVEFDAQELMAIRDFVATSAGAKYIARSPNILASPGVSKWNQDFYKRIQSQQQLWLQDMLDEMAEFLETKNEEQS